MILQDNDFKDLVRLAEKAAVQAGEMIASFSDMDVPIQMKSTGTSRAAQVVTEVDLKSDQMIYERLADSCCHYDLAYLSEEREDDGRRLLKDYFWCVDPLDGTLPFTKNRPGYSVSIALVSQGGESHLGVIYDPSQKRLYSAVKGQGVFVDGRAWSMPSYQGGEVCVDGGGAVMNACRVLEQAPAYFVKKPKLEEGGGCLWDYAATVCLFEEAGAYAKDYYGQPLDLNHPSCLFMNRCGVVFASHKEIIQHLFLK